MDWSHRTIASTVRNHINIHTRIIIPITIDIAIAPLIGIPLHSSVATIGIIISIVIIGVFIVVVAATAAVEIGPRPSSLSWCLA